MFGDAVRRQRRRAGLTQEDVAARAGLSVRTLRHLESGHTAAPRSSTVRLLADVFRLTGPELAEFQAAATSESDPVISRPAGRPAQLPGSTPGFTGRAAELERLTTLLEPVDAGSGVAVVCGGAGVGKTALVLHWARTVADRYPDGQLFVDLRGFSPDGMTVSTAEALRTLLAGLGVPPERIPAGDAAQEAFYRTVLSGRHLLVVLDNARDVEQVRPLLPGSPECRAVVTSRSTLPGLLAVENAGSVPLSRFTADEARQMVTARLSRARVRAEAGSVDEVVHACAGLPLALAVVSARAAARPDFALATVAEELRSAATTVDALAGFGSPEHPGAAFSWSYNQLRPEVARVFRLLGLHSGPEIGLAAAASLAARSFAQSRALLDELVTAHLLEELRPARYGFHDLLRDYASALGDADPEAPEARRRMLDHYAHTAHSAALLITPAQEPLELPPRAPGTQVLSFDGPDQAQDWLFGERDALVAAARTAARRRADAHVRQLAWSLITLFERRGDWEVNVELQRAALDAALRSGTPVEEGLARKGLGAALTWVCRFDESEEHLLEAGRLFAAAGRLRLEAGTHLSISILLERVGRLDEAEKRARLAEAGFEAADDQRGRARALNCVGWFVACAGRPKEAEPVLRQSIELFNSVSDPVGEGSALDSLGYALLGTDRPGPAVACFRRANELFVAAHDRHSRAVTLGHLGDALAADGSPDEAHDVWTQALVALEELGEDAQADDVRARLAGASEN